MRKPRKNDTPAEKVAIVRRHLIDPIALPGLRHQHPLSPTVFSLWQEQFSENSAAAFERESATPDVHLQRTIVALRVKLRRQNVVVAELMEEHIKLKKLGEIRTESGFPASTTEADVETIIQRARGRFPDEGRRIISDDGTQYIAEDFKELTTICVIIHVL